MENRIKCEWMQKLGEELIACHPSLLAIRDNGIRIVYLESDSQRLKGGSYVYGCCEKINPKNKWAIDYDYSVTFYIRNIAYMDESQLQILMLHELLHICVKVDGQNNLHLSCTPHDVEDFREIIEEYGLDWAEPKYKQITMEALDEQG